MLFIFISARLDASHASFGHRIWYLILLLPALARDGIAQPIFTILSAIFLANWRKVPGVCFALCVPLDQRNFRFVDDRLFLDLFFIELITTQRCIIVGSGQSQDILGWLQPSSIVLVTHLGCQSVIVLKLRAFSFWSFNILQHYCYILLI